MERVVVTDDMRQRILRNIQNADIQPKAKGIRFPYWQRYAAAAACAAVLLLGALTVPGILHPTAVNPAVGAPDESSPVDGAAQFVTCDSADALSQTIGFPMADLSALPFEPTGTAYISIFGEIAEIDYTGANGETAVYRKSIGTEDNSGNYESFPDSEQITVGGNSILLKGTGSQYVLAEWTDGTYAYSIALSGGVTADAWNDILKTVS